MSRSPVRFTAHLHTGSTDSRGGTSNRREIAVTHHNIPPSRTKQDDRLLADLNPDEPVIHCLPQPPTG
jgi:hypothetical protein